MLLLRFLFLFFSAVKETSCSFSQLGNFTMRLAKPQD